jgi:hypothetical protein
MARIFLPQRRAPLTWRQLLAGAAIVGSMPLSYWLFGWRAANLPSVGFVTYHRFLGRATVTTVDADRDGRIDGRYEYRWREPATAPGARPWRYAEDRDRDGRMDLWVTELGPNADGEPELRFDVDTDRDGEPDWSFRTLDSLSGYQAVAERRGW